MGNVVFNEAGEILVAGGAGSGDEWEEAEALGRAVEGDWNLEMFVALPGTYIRAFVDGVAKMDAGLRVKVC